MTLAATNLFPDTPIPGPLRIAGVPILGDLFFRMAFGRWGLSAMWLGAVADRTAFPYRRHRAALRSRRGVSWTRRVLHASLRDLPGLYAGVERAARALRIPALVLWGDQDPFFPARVGERTAAALGVELQVLRGCGHFVPEERPDEVAAGILALVERCADGALGPREVRAPRHREPLGVMARARAWAIWGSRTAFT